MQPPRTGRRRLSGATRAIACLLLGVALAGCSVLGGGNQRDRATIYAPDPRATLDPALQPVAWQLALSAPNAARFIDSFRIAVRPTPDELQVYRGANWAKPPSDMLLDTLLRALEDSGKIPAVARQGTGISADYKLVLDLRRFDADYAGNAVPAATIELNAKLIHNPEQAIVASRTFLHAQPAHGTGVPQVVDAFSSALEATAAELGGWVLASGAAHQRSAHPGEPR